VQKQLHCGKIVSDFLSSPVSNHTKSSQVNFVLFYVGPVELLLLVNLCCNVKVFNMQGDPLGIKVKCIEKKAIKVHDTSSIMCVIKWVFIV
jgi:hypothetical protein